MKEVILGISAYYHDSSACIVIDGKIIAAAQEERFTKIKGDSSFPHNAINCCLNEAGITFDQITKIAFYENHLNKFLRIIYSAHLNAPLGIKSFLASIPKWITTNLWLENKIRKELNTKKQIYFYEHHYSHAASAFFPSPYEKSAIITMDGVGEWATATYGIGEKNNIKLIKQMEFPDSIGLLYSAFTYYLGFKINSGEYKVMGLAPYGKPIYSDLIKEKLVKIYDDGSIKLNQYYFNYCKGLTMINKRFEELFDEKIRKPESEIMQKHMDIAASLQDVLNEIVLKMANHVQEETKLENLVLAGGIALNVAAIGNLKLKSKFKNIWVQPASGDAGGSLGAALLAYYENNDRIVNEDDSMQGSLLGNTIVPNDNKISKKLKRMGGNFKLLNEQQLINKIVSVLMQNKVVGVARGRMEFGPRALGNRSILANAQDLKNQSVLNLKIKKRESFRPFAPIVLEEDAKQYFDIKDSSPYMLSTYYIKEDKRISQNLNLQGMKLLNQSRSDIPAVTHIDYSARVQTVDKKRNKFLYNLLNEYKKKTKCSVLINTSFNVRGKPIVSDEEDAYICFMNTEMDYVVIGNRFFAKEDQDYKAFYKYLQDINYVGGDVLD